MNSSKVYFVVVTYNGMNWIERCLNSIYANDCSNIVVVDNNSSDHTVNFISNNFPEVKLFALKSNMGFGVANNKGISYAMERDCEFVFLLNQDAYLEPKALGSMIKTMQSDSEIAIVSPIHLNGSQNAFDNSFCNYLMTGTKNTFLNDLYFNRLKEVYEVSFVNAAAWLLSKRCIERIGLFDAIFFHYGEDINYCQRAIYHNFKICINTKAIVLHDREDRGGKIRQEYAQDQFIRKKLIDFCNPFRNAESEIKIFLKKQRIKIAKSIITMDYRKFVELKRTIIIIESKRNLIIENALKNRT